MKDVQYWIISLAVFMLSCNNSGKYQNTSKDSTRAVAEGPGKIIDENYLIVAGKSIGAISVGDSLQKVNRLFGNADAGDAAMGKAWAIWYTKHPTTTKTSEFCIFSSYRDSSMKDKNIKQIRTTSILYKTQDGFGIARTLEDTRAKYSSLKLVSTYLDDLKDTITIYDDAEQGIGFEFMNGKSTAVSVHKSNQPIQKDYLSPKPSWKLVD